MTTTVKTIGPAKGARRAKTLIDIVPGKPVISFTQKERDCDMSVRRLTPMECERLQGFPDDYTRITYRGKPAADGPRYKALGNSMAVPVMRKIGERIAMVDALSNERAA
jgi:DNA (cytosine-5)-methyltransferase 1